MNELTEAERQIVYRALAVYRQELWREYDQPEARQVNLLMARFSQPRRTIPPQGTPS